MIRVVLLSHNDGAEREEGYIEFTDLLSEQVNNWAYRCQPSGLVTFQQVKEVAEHILLCPQVDSGTIGKYRWKKMARTTAGTHRPSPRSCRHT